MRITNPSEIKIGMWASMCCHRDIYQIASQDEIESIVDDWDEGISYDVFDSKTELLLFIRQGFDDVKELAVIDKLLAEPVTSLYEGGLVDER